MRGEFKKGSGPKLAMIRSLLRRDTDIVVLTETRTTQSAVKRTKLKWGLKPTHHSLDEQARAGVVIYTKREHTLVPNSKRTATEDGHMAAAVYEIHGSRIVVVGVYGKSENNDITSNNIFKEVYNTIRELQHLYQTHHVILLGDFNAVWRDVDANSFHSTKPRTTATLIKIMETFGLWDLAVQAGKDKEHTWHRRGHGNQSSRIDHIMTSIPHEGLQMEQIQLTTKHTIFDHAWIEATLGPNIIKKPPIMKDYVLGSDEYLIKSTEWLERVKEVYGKRPAGEALDEQEEQLPNTSQQEEQEEQSPKDEGLSYSNCATGKMALHVLNETIQKLQKMHNDIGREKQKHSTKNLRETSAKLAHLKKQLKKQNTAARMAEIHEQITELQHNLSNDIEAKEKAAQMRIQNFYRDGTGRMVPQSFYIIKEKRQPRKINKLIIDNEEITEENRITTIMQEWYETTAMATTEQTMTLHEFLTK